MQIVTGDRDLSQLVDDARGVQVLYPIKGVGTLQITDDALLMEKYGVNGSQCGDLAGIQAAAVDPVALQELSERWRLGTPVKRLLDALAQNGKNA